MERSGGLIPKKVLRWQTLIPQKWQAAFSFLIGYFYLIGYFVTWKGLSNNLTVLAERRVSFMFMGEYNHTIDAKNRLIIPSKFREALGDEFVVTKGLDGCLFVYDNKEWSSFEEKLRSLPLTNKDARTFVRFFLAGAASVEVDKQGRVLIPSVLKEFAGINKEVTLIGVASRIEIWSKERWEGESAYEDMESIAEHMSELGLGI